MKLVVGLGNPGRKYEGTRHNIGFAVLDELARRHGDGQSRLSFQGQIVDVTLLGKRAILLAPHTYMNKSGTSVVLARDFFKLKNHDLLVVCDDLNLPRGKLRVRAKGSSGGQKGLEDIIRAVGDDFARLRVGIGSPPEGWERADWVLGKFTKEDRDDMQIATVQAADAVSVWVDQGLAACMNQFNL